MTREFDHVRKSFHDSALDSLASRLSSGVAAAWESSLLGGVLRLALQPSTARAEGWIRFTGIAVVTAAIVQAILRRLMPATVAPALPIILVLIVSLVGLLAALFPAQLAHASRSSTLTRRLFPPVSGA